MFNYISNLGGEGSNINQKCIEQTALKTFTHTHTHLHLYMQLPPMNGLHEIIVGTISQTSVGTMSQYSITCHLVKMKNTSLPWQSLLLCDSDLFVTSVSVTKELQ